MRSNTRQQKLTYTYGTRFERVLQKFFALAVVLVQCALPIAPVFASDETVAPQAEQVVVLETPSAEVPVPEVVSTEIPVEQVVPIIETVEIPIDIQQPDTLPETVTEPEILPIEVTLLQSDETISEENVLQNSSAEEVVGADSAQQETASSTLVTTDETPVVSETASTSVESTQAENVDTPATLIDEVTTELIPADGATPTPSSTQPVTVVQPEYHVVVNDTNRFSFSEQECARVGDGSFYCSTGVATVTETGVNRVFSAPDADGDQEIYIEHDGALTQVTTNLTDDSAPYYDEESDSIVWHRLVGERYQIVSYDIKSATEEVLTADRYNNMQPSRGGKITVWQGWIGNDWEIMLDTSGEITMLTDNTTNDIAPRINGDYIIWQSYEGDAWKAKIYNIRTKEIETIADTEGTSVENPRFVLVYDAKSENGDVETKGYDPVSGASVPLSAEPTPTPSDIPDPDQTGEKRALITTSAQLKTKTEDESDPNALPNEPTPMDPNITATSTRDVVVPAFSASSTEQIADTVAASTTEILDIVIPAPTEVLPAIPDLVVEPFVPVFNEEVLPQQTVATSS